MGLRQIANQYHAHANKVARRRADKDGKLPARFQRAVTYYRDCAAKIEALILPEDEVKTEETQGTQWQLEAEEGQSLLTSKVTAKDKVATPQELLKKAK
jgi:hypothetical protein